MLSFATKKELPKPGEKRMLFQQPLHRGQYAEFEGTLTSGYGKGTVRTHDKGKVIVTKATPTRINFIVAHHKYPEFYTLIRASGVPKSPATARQAATQGGSWLMINTTPLDATKLLGGKPGQVGLEKLRYTKVPAAEVDKVFDPKYLVQEKIDGASALYHILSDRIDVLSYRVSKTGRPILHTYRVFGPGGGRVATKLPGSLSGTILRGEIYGERAGKTIPPQELGGILNASVARSLEKQREQQVRMRNMLFDVVRWGKEPVPPKSLGAEERLERLDRIMKYLPKSQFRLPETARTPEEARQLWERVVSGKHPRTAEGVVAWPKEPGKVPIKVKQRPERDVWIKDIFPGEKGLEGLGAGGFEYSLAPEGPVVGRVGTGFSEQTRREMLADPEAWKGRMARISAQERFPSGAYRAPSFTSLHEDYPLRKASGAANVLYPLGIAAGGIGLSHILSSRLEKKTEQSVPLKKEQLRRLLNTMGAKNVVKVWFTQRQVEKLPEKIRHSTMGAYVPPTTAGGKDFQKMLSRAGVRLSAAKRRKIKRYGMVLGQKKYGPYAYAHELGHATGTPKEPPMRERGFPYGQLLAIPAAFGVGALAGTRRSWPTWAKMLGGAAGGAGAGIVGAWPVLREEHRATGRAVKGLEGAGVAPEEIDKARSALRTALGTYVNAAAYPAAMLGALGVRAVVR